MRLAKLMVVALAIAGMVRPSVGAPPCTGNCNGDAEVTTDELLLGVGIALGSAEVGQCLPMDNDGNGVTARHGNFHLERRRDCRSHPEPVTVPWGTWHA